jgi:hypothetical protein
MSSHSEEMWESFDALWRRLEQLGKRVKELEARLSIVESAGAQETASEFEPGQTGRSISLYEGEIRR